MLLLFCLLPFFAGCSSTVKQRAAFFANLAPEPVAEQVWKNCIGNYRGTIHTTARAFGSTGDTVTEVRFQLTGSPTQPLIDLEMDSACSSTWDMSGTYNERFTNIPQRSYGIFTKVSASSHGPNQLLIHLNPKIGSPYRGAAMILSFHGNGTMGIDFIGHFGRRGTGRLERSL